MKKFLSKDFLLNTKIAEKLYHDVAAKKPIIDYHCHINPQEIAEDKSYDNITQVWLYGDHYKWRAMRNCGVDEKYITGNASDYEKFEKWAETMPSLIGNPLYHWTHLELKKYFGYTGIFSKKTAKEVWDICNEKLASISAKSIIKDSNVDIICTTDDPVDSLEYHKQIADDESFDVKVLPAFRPDKAMNIEKDDFEDYISKLEDVTGSSIDSFTSLKSALSQRIEYFNSHGCKVSDHALEYVICIKAEDDEIESIFNKKISGKALSVEEIVKFKTAMLLFLSSEYATRDWAMQIHYGSIRNINDSMYGILGPDTGYDAISTKDSAMALANLLNEMEKSNALPKTIVYSLNPNDDAMICTVIGCFQKQGIRSKLQHGAAWWFNDTKLGMIKQLENLASISVLGNFVGMLTDSRSFLSYTRHEYFRRILCNMMGDLVENGEYPNDFEQLSVLVNNICYDNALEYFEFK